MSSRTFPIRGIRNANSLWSGRRTNDLEGLETLDDQQASDADGEPEDYALKEWLCAAFPQGFLGKARTDKEQGDGETTFGDRHDGGAYRCRNADGGEQVGVDDHGDGEEEDEPGDYIQLALAAVLTEEQHGHEGEGQNPEGACALYHGGNLKALVAVGRCGAHHGTGVVDGDGGPFAELLVGKSQEVAQRRENQEGEGVQYENRSQGNAHLLVIGIYHGGHSRDGGTAANGSAAAHEIGGLWIHLDHFTHNETEHHDRCDGDDGEHHAVLAGGESRLQVHAEAKSHYAALQQVLLGFLRELGERRTAENKGVDDARQKSHPGCYMGAAGGENQKDECELCDIRFHNNNPHYFFVP